MTLAEKISVLRKQNDMSQDALAAKLVVSAQTVSKWETGELAPEIGTLVKLSEIFDVSLDYLLKNENVTTKHDPPGLRVQMQIDSGSNFFSDEEETERESFGIDIKGGIWPLALLAFLVLGLFDILPWGRAWIVFLIAWVLEEIIDWYRTGRLSISVYSVAGLLFLGVGFFGIVPWSQAWLIFVAAWVVEEIFISPNKKRKKKKKKKYND